MIKNIIKHILFSLSIINGLNYLVRYPLYVAGYILFSKLQVRSGKRFGALAWKERYPYLADNTATTIFDTHYIYHPAWTGRFLEQIRLSVHFDISSMLSFYTIVSPFVPVEFYDCCPVEHNLNNLVCKHGDLMEMPFQDGSVESLSCMHVVEHIEMGRYGDPLDPDGDLKAIVELERVFAKGNSLLFVTTVDESRIRYNAHCINSYDRIISYFWDLYVEQFALVDDKGLFSINADPFYANQPKYGCGCWWFKK